MRRVVVPIAIAVAAVLVAGAIGGGEASLPRPLRANAYRVVYQVMDMTAGRRDVHAESVDVRRPYDGRLETLRRGRVLSGRVTNREYLWQLIEGGVLAFGVRRPPGGPARDVSFAVLRDAARDGVISRGGSETVLGRRCYWFAYGDAAPLALRPPRAGTRIESCVDAAGIVLRESWAYKGKNARIVEATRVEAGPRPDAVFLVGKNPETEKVKVRGAEAVIRLGFIVVDNAQIFGVPLDVRAPAGWKLGRRAVYAIGGGDRQGRPTQLLSDAYERGSELAVVERGTNSKLSPPWGPNEGREVRLQQGVGRIVYFLDRVEVRLVSSLGFARVIAPSRAVALRFAAGISPAS